ncbi:DoxX family protein [Polynucleobacter sp. AM-26B4]|uniref:DoxX family protein n=1 Tax=Polynucleobacter sp. AM-26B4 TaxID=2689103 RepID=UPI001C0C3303|nr:DoxX family protein [Polynucleobacter sp. AM-26B4]MBU3585891.1 DoxX family protein [Polynucleobacter sp. AM-26B4]
MKTYQNTLNLLGRLLIVALFLPAGLSKVTGFDGTVGYFTSLGMFLPTLAVIIAIIAEVAGGLALLVGFKTRIVAILLAVFTLAATIIGHAYWAAPADAAFIQQLLFFKNIAVIGGLMVLASSGAGKFSIDGFKDSK